MERSLFAAVWVSRGVAGNLSMKSANGKCGGKSPQGLVKSEYKSSGLIL